MEGFPAFKMLVILGPRGQFLQCQIKETFGSIFNRCKSILTTSLNM